CDIALDVTAAADIGMFELDRYKELFEIGKEAVSAHSKEFIALLNGNWNSKKVLS
ncbi:MAG: hypothetical protein HKN45_10855, partial [Flavobacteriales bacterium]|nr:hypothetical protein [Flavobacteriales bacterium]